MIIFLEKVTMKLQLIFSGWRQWLNTRQRRSLQIIPSTLFLVSLVITLLLNSFNPAIAQWIIPSNPAAPQLPFPEIHGVWITSDDFNTIKDSVTLHNAVSQLRQLNFNTIYPVVWNSGYVMYPSAVARSIDIQPFVLRGADGHDILPDIVNQAHQQGLLVIPWFEFGFMAPASSELAMNKPEWFTQKQDGNKIDLSETGEVMWLNPFHPEVQKFIISLVAELINKYPVDGIQFDDHMSLPSEFGYDPYTVALYTQEHHKKPPSNPQDPEWLSWRANKITAFIGQLNQVVKTRRPQAIFSISPNYYEFAYKFQLQDWLGWIRLNLVDELIVQVYRSDLKSFITDISRPELQEAQLSIPTAVGIMSGLRNSPVGLPQIQYQVRAAQQRKLGIVFFYYESLWSSAPESPSERIAAFKNFFPYPASRVTLRQF